MVGAYLVLVERTMPIQERRTQAAADRPHDIDQASGLSRAVNQLPALVFRDDMAVAP